MDADIAERCRKLVADLKIGRPEDLSNITPLTGGVASDIVRFDLDGQSYCAKFALGKLKVAQDWYAPVHRNAAEYAWLAFAADACPDNAVRLHGRSTTENGFVMAYVSGDDVSLWKSDLLQAKPADGTAARVADLLGRLQKISTAPGFDQGPFQNRDDFRDLRIDPYLTATAQAHPDLAPELTRMGDDLYAAHHILVHGDVSPKNILIRAGHPIFLDAECATMGDACFDPSFCLNHLVLKAIHLPQTRAARLKDVSAFWDSYLPHVTFEDPSAVEARVARLVPMLMLARVDGKSPVEYLSEPDRAVVRDLARDMISAPPMSLNALVSRVRAALP